MKRNNANMHTLFYLALATIIISALIVKFVNFTLIAIFILLGVVFLSVMIAPFIIKSRYTNIIFEQSSAIKNLRNLNDRYRFKEIPAFNLTSVYDNEKFYREVSPEDYLTYQLIYIKFNVKTALQSLKYNSDILPEYLTKVDEINKARKEYVPNHVLFKKFYKSIESELFRKSVKNPLTVLKIPVRLILTKINGTFVTEKNQTFYEDKINSIIQRLNDKQGDFYQDEKIWQSICRVERAKVTNKMRFSIYNRDGNRCRICGSPYNLEIDHIFPISKGGKSTYDNLQTLCHDCNVRKSNSVHVSTSSPNYTANRQLCPLCREGTLILKDGRNGKFYQCTNYPECHFTKKFYAHTKM